MTRTHTGGDDLSLRYLEQIKANNPTQMRLVSGHVECTSHPRSIAKTITRTNLAITVRCTVSVFAGASFFNPFEVNTVSQIFSNSC